MPSGARREELHVCHNHRCITTSPREHSLWLGEEEGRPSAGNLVQQLVEGAPGGVPGRRRSKEGAPAARRPVGEQHDRLGRAQIQLEADRDDEPRARARPPAAAAGQGRAAGSRRGRPPPPVGPAGAARDGSGGRGGSGGQLSRRNGPAAAIPGPGAASPAGPPVTAAEVGGRRGGGPAAAGIPRVAQVG